MLITEKYPAVAQLVAKWNRARSSPIVDHHDFSQELRGQLAQQLVQSLALFGGQIILLYHEFLTMEPTGEHSFAYGSSMQSKTVYWVTVARLTQSPELVAERSPGRTMDLGEMKIRITPSTKYCIPVQWQWSLYPYYPSGSNEPAFGFTQFGRLLLWSARREPDKVSTPRTDPLDISCLGDFLFKARQDEYDWATKIELHLGTEAVRGWLDRHRSVEAFEQLDTLQQLP